MHPEVFKLGPFVVQSYGIMLALSFILGIYLAVKNGEKKSVSGDDIMNLGFLIIISSVFGARLFYVLFHLSEFKGRWVYTFWPVQENGTVGLGGLILLGGFITAFLASAIFIHIRKLNFWVIADAVAPGIAIGIFLTRIGCFLNGCCFGKVSNLPFAVSFPPHCAAGSVMGDAHLHPTQLYSSAYGLIIFLTLLFLQKKIKFDGGIFAIFLILYGIARFVVDIFRYYESQMYLFLHLDFNQIVSLLMILAGIIMYFLGVSRQIKFPAQGE